ncbi:MAG TPA: hypothetical protein VF607_11595, partial [Verrucomicrobiae bacterium]
RRGLIFSAAVILLVTVVGFGLAGRYFLSERLWAATHSYVTPATKIGSFGFVEGSLVWRYRSVTTNYLTLGDPKQAAHFLTNSPPYILIVPTTYLTNLPDTNGIQFQVRGLDLVKFKFRDLTAIVHP